MLRGGVQKYLNLLFTKNIIDREESTKLYHTIQKYVVGKMLLRLLCRPRLQLIYQKYSKSEILLQFKITVFYFNIF